MSYLTTREKIALEYENMARIVIGILVLCVVLPFVLLGVFVGALRFGYNAGEGAWGILMEWLRRG